MIKAEIELLLVKNGYKKDPIFNYYCIPKKAICYFFYVNEETTTVGKIAWNNIKFQDIKTIRTKSFQPHNYSLVTDLDIKQIIATKQRMAVNQAKHKAAKEKGFVDLQIPQEEVPPNTD